MTKTEAETAKGGRLRLRPVCLAVLLCPLLTGCASAVFDMRGFDQPVTLSANPFACHPDRRPGLVRTDTCTATVAWAKMFSSSGNNQTKESTVFTDEAEVAAFKKIGGDPAMTITGICMKTHTFGVNIGLALAYRAELVAVGDVRKIKFSEADTQEVGQ